MRRLLVVLTWLTGAIVTDARGQNSVFGVLGVGFPGRPVAVRSRAMGGAFASFDARSAVNPAAITGFRQLTAMATSGTTFRSYTALDSAATGLRETRFPYGIIGGYVQGSPISFAASYATYAERTYELATRDTVSIRGEAIEVVDRLASEGAVVDIRGALGWQVVRGFRLGAAVHLLSGSARLSTERDFASTKYAPLRERDRLAFSGVGFSAGFVLTPGGRFALAGAVRTDSKLDATRDSVPAGSVELPLSFTGGLFLQLHAAIGWATSVAWHSWSDAAPDLAAVGAEQAFDTWAVASGIEIGGTDAGGTFPLRLGVRYAQLPFSPTADQPHELAASVGTAVRFASDRAEVDLSVERASRKGAGADESAWQFSFGFTVRP